MSILCHRKKSADLVQAEFTASASCSTSRWMLMTAWWRCDGSNWPSELGVLCGWNPEIRCCSICWRCNDCISSISRAWSRSCFCCCSSSCCWARCRCSKLLTTNPPGWGWVLADCGRRPSVDSPPSSTPACNSSFFDATSWRCRFVTCRHRFTVAPERTWKWDGRRHTAHVWRAKNCCAPPLFFGSTSTTSLLGECFRDGQYSLVSSLSAVLLLTVPPCPAICKSLGHVPPVPYWSRRQCRFITTRLNGLAMELWVLVL